MNLVGKLSISQIMLHLEHRWKKLGISPRNHLISHNEVLSFLCETW